MSGAADPGRVGLVLVSHSGLVARGAAEMAAQLAPAVRIVPVGGDPDGGLGTDFDGVRRALDEADSGAGVVMLTDLGSAIMVAETAIEQLPPPRRERALLADAPIVEGAVAAAVAAQTGVAVAAVRRAAEGAAKQGSGAAAAASPRYARTVTLRNEDGLHARPAAEFVKLAAAYSSRVTVQGRDARSLLAILSLGLTQGATIEIASEDPNGNGAVDALVALVERGFERSAG